MKNIVVVKKIKAMVVGVPVRPKSMMMTPDTSSIQMVHQSRKNPYYQYA